MTRLLSAFLLGALFISCDENGYDHYYTEYTVNSADSLVVNYLDKDEVWQIDTVAKGFYYEFKRQPFQRLEIKVQGLAINQRIVAAIRAERENLGYLDKTGDSLYLELKVDDYPNFKN